jgi:hypothetical protein
MTRRERAIAAALLCALLGEARPAHAYLDPSTGSMLISAIVAFFATLAMAVRMYWCRIASLLRPTPARDDAEPPAPPADTGRRR